MYTKTAIGIARYSMLIALSIFVLTISLSAQVNQSTSGGMLVDESLITLKNKKLVFQGLSSIEVNSGYSIISIVQGAEQGSVDLVDDNQIQYNPTANLCDEKDHFSYLITDGSYQNVKEVSVEILCEPLAILSSMSPDGDGQQDSFVIIGIDSYPENELVIFNELGLEIFREDNYNNDWDGKYQGKNLPLGVYYYVFRTDQGEIISGYLYMREAT